MELYQQAKSGEQRHFRLKAGRELHITHSHKQKTRHYAFSLLALQDRGRRVSHYRKRWLLLGLACLGLLFVLFYLGRLAGDEQVVYLPYLYMCLLLAAVGCFVFMVLKGSQSYLFYSVYTQLPLVEFWSNQPSRQEFQDFIIKLEEAIRQHRASMNIPYSHQLAGEMRTLRRVMEAGILSESVYHAARAKLLLLSDANDRTSLDPK